MSKASRMGIIEDGTYEVVVETDAKGKMNRAPMGLIKKDDTLILKVYEESDTYKNLSESGEGRIYIVEDPRFLHESDNPRWSAMALFTVKASSGKDPAVFELEVGGVKSLKQDVKAINRAPGLFTEFLIDYSRKDIDEEAAGRLEHYRKVIAKVAPDSYYKKKVEELR